MDTPGSSSRRPLAPSRIRNAPTTSTPNDADDDANDANNAINQPIPILSASDLLALPRSTRLNHLLSLLTEKSRQVSRTGELGQLLTRQVVELETTLEALKRDGEGDEEDAMVLKDLQERLESYRDENEDVIKDLATLVSWRTGWHLGENTSC